MTMAALIKNICLGLAYSFRDLGHYQHGGRREGMQAGIVLEKGFLYLQIESNCSHAFADSFFITSLSSTF